MATDDLTAEQPQTLSVLPGELWLPVVGYEGLYEVSSLGRVKCCAKKLRTWYGERRSRERFLKKKLNSQTGYVKLVLQRDRKLKHTNVHVQVLLAFVGQAPSGHEARHLNGVRDDNRLTNLAWGTKRENMRDQYGHGTRVVADKHPKSKLTPSMVEHIRTSPMTGVELARTMGLGTATICRVRQGKSSATLLGAAPSA